MKINEINRQLDEGFFSSFIDKVKGLAGDNGPAGLIRALLVNGSALNKVADAIVNKVTPKILASLGNAIKDIQAGTAPMPIGAIYKQAAFFGSSIAALDNSNIVDVDLPLITQTIKSNKLDILKIVLNGDTGDDANVKLIFAAVARGAATANIGIQFTEVIKTVSLIVAGTIVFIQTQQANSTTEFDAEAVGQFNTLGADIKTLLFLDNSPALLSLSPNEKLRHALDNLLITLITTVKDKFITMPVEQLTAAAANPPALLHPTLVANALGRHTAGLDPAAVNAAATALMQLLAAQFKIWLTLAVTDQTPGRPRSYDLYREWASEALLAIDGLKIGTPEELPAEMPAAAPAKHAKPAKPARPAKPAKPATQPTPPHEKITFGGHEVKPGTPFHDKIIASMRK